MRVVPLSPRQIDVRFWIDSVGSARQIDVVLVGLGINQTHVLRWSWKYKKSVCQEIVHAVLQKIVFTDRSLP